MIKANFSAYSKYITDSLNQWDLNQVLKVSGLNLSSAPEVHFSNSAMDRAIVRQATVENHVISVDIPNSLLQDPLRIFAHIGIYDGPTFKVVELVEIPVIPRKRPADYQIEDSDGEVHSFKRLENMLQNKADAAAINARVDNIIAQNNTTDGNSELVDLRVDVDGNTHASAGAATRAQAELLAEGQRLAGDTSRASFAPFAKWARGGLTNAQPMTDATNRIYSSNVLHFGRDLTIHITAGFKIGVHTLTPEGAFLSDSGWQNTGCDVPAGTYFKMVVARVQEVASEKADITTFSAAVSFDTYMKAELDKITDDVTTLSAAVERNKTLIESVAGQQTTDVTGAYFTAGGAVQPNNRIHAADIVCDDMAVITYKGQDKALRYGVDLYTNDGTRTRISASGWQTAHLHPVFTVSGPCLIDLAIAKDDDSTFDSPNNMDGLFEVTLGATMGSIKSEIEAIANAVQDAGRCKTWLTSAHRGLIDSTLRENCLAAYYNAYLHGADMIETDARLASDSVLVANHDATATGTDTTGQQVTYTVAETPSTVLGSLVLSESEKWGTQYVPTLAQVLHLAYHTGLQVNIDLKDGIAAAEAVAKLVLKHGMQGRVVYALNGSGMAGINTILAIDPDARFIDSAPGFMAQVADYAERGKRCYAYTSDPGAVEAIRAGGCMVALISLNADNFGAAITHHPDMCEYLHTSDFRQIENAYFETLKLY